jgi:hypothetical protein
MRPTAAWALNTSVICDGVATTVGAAFKKTTVRDVSVNSAPHTSHIPTDAVRMYNRSGNAGQKRCSKTSSDATPPPQTATRRTDRGSLCHIRHESLRR